MAKCRRQQVVIPSGLGLDAQELLQLFFAVVRGDEEGFIQDFYGEQAVLIRVAGGDAGLGQLTLGASQGLIPCCCCEFVLALAAKASGVQSGSGSKDGPH